LKNETFSHKIIDSPSKIGGMKIKIQIRIKIIIFNKSSDRNFSLIANEFLLLVSDLINKRNVNTIPANPINKKKDT